MDTLIIIGAKYLIIVVGLVAAIATLLSERAIIKKIVPLVVLSFAVAFLSAWIVGLFYYDSRPFVVEHIEPLISHKPDNGFPSDHTLFAMVAAATIFVYHRKLGVLLGVLAILVGVSRVMAKVHYPIDIVGSVAIAIAATFICFIVLKKVCGK
jgi:undecaprenyl-diphosphatase